MDMNWYIFALAAPFLFIGSFVVTMFFLRLIFGDERR